MAHNHIDGKAFWAYKGLWTFQLKFSGLEGARRSR